MKSELWSVTHSIAGVCIMEVWHDGQFICTVAGATAKACESYPNTRCRLSWSVQFA